MALGVLCATTTSARSMQPLRVVSWGNLQEVYVHTSRACFEYARVEVLHYTQHLPYRGVAVSSREERRPCFLVSPVLLQNVSNL